MHGATSAPLATRSSSVMESYDAHSVERHAITSEPLDHAPAKHEAARHLRCCQVAISVAVFMNFYGIVSLPL